MFLYEINFHKSVWSSCQIEEPIVSNDLSVIDYKTSLTKISHTCRAYRISFVQTLIKLCKRLSISWAYFMWLFPQYANDHCFSINITSPEPLDLTASANTQVSSASLKNKEAFSKTISPWSWAGKLFVIDTWTLLGESEGPGTKSITRMPIFDRASSLIYYTWCCARAKGIALIIVHQPPSYSAAGTYKSPW